MLCAFSELVIDDADGGLKLLGLGMAALTLIALPVSALRSRFTQARLGGVAVDLSSRAVPAGDQLEVSIDIPESREVHINSISATLEGNESVEGNDDQRQLHMIYQDEHSFPQAEQLTLPAGQALRLRHRFPIPPAAPPSFHVMKNHVEWRVEVAIDIEGWPQWKRVLLFEVHPAAEPQPDPSQPASRA